MSTTLGSANFLNESLPVPRASGRDGDGLGGFGERGMSRGFPRGDGRDRDRGRILVANEAGWVDILQ